jgi:hypothetical protein
MKLKKKLLIPLIIMIIIIIVFISLIINFKTENYIILIVTKHQSDTASLNPTRLEVASEMALNKLNETSKKHNKITHKYIFYTGNEMEGYKKVEEFLKSNSNVIALLGDFNSAGTSLLASLALKYEIPHISLFAIDETIFHDNPWSFSYRSTLAQEHETMMGIINDLNSKNVAFISCDLSNILSRSEEFRKVLKAENKTIFYDKIFSREEKNFKEQIEFLIKEQDNYDSIILFLASNQIEHFLQQAYIYNIQKPIIISVISMSFEGVKELQGIELEMHSFVPLAFLKLSEDDEEFLSLANYYRIAIGYHRFDSLGPWIYDAMILLHELILSNKTPEELRNSLQNYNDMRIIGPVSFNQNGILEESTFKKVKIIDGSFYEVTK